MKYQRSISKSARPALSSQHPREIDIRSLLEWAFQREQVGLDFNEVQTVSGGGPRGVGMEWVLMQRRLLGCKVDGGGRSDPHPDAEIVASALSALPEGCGGRLMALRIAELARAGEVPDYMGGARLCCEPVAYEGQRRNGVLHAKAIVIGQQSYVSRGRRRTVDVRWCPVRYRNDERQIAGAHRSWLQWWGAMIELRDTFRIYGGLSCFTVTKDMPPMEPWKKQLTRKSQGVYK